jgi:PTH1 family peptidyl-tRNA hydrolase
MTQKNTSVIPQLTIKAIIGLGNPGPSYAYTHHNIGFLVLDAIADQHHATWQKKENMELASCQIQNQKILLVKPQTFMNNSGEVLGYLKKQGINQDNILVVHDELELEFAQLKFKFDGSAKGHNGLKSIMAHGGSNFLRLRFGIDRPASPDLVPDYVLAKFKQPKSILQEQIDHAYYMIDQYLQNTIK